MKRLSTIIALVLAVAMLLIQGCAPKETGHTQEQQDQHESNGPVSGGSLVVATNMDVVDGWDPTLATAWGSSLAMELVYGKLVQYDQKMQVVPDLAESWHRVDDLVYEVKLRQGVKWHDGVDFTAEDVKYSLERILDPSCLYRSKIESIDRVEIVDKYTVRLHLKYPDGTLFANLADTGMSMVPKHILEAGGDLRTKPIGTGPFMMVEHVPDSYIKYAKNPYYYEEGKPYLDEIVMRIIKDDSGKIAALRAGQVDLINLNDMQHVAELRKDPNLVVVANPSVTSVVLFGNMKRKPFDDIRVRKAISMAINREEILQVVGFGEGTLTGPIPPANAYWALPESEIKEAYKVDIEGAKRLLEEAGYPNGFKTTIQVNNTYPYTIPVGQVVQRQLGAVGIEVEIQTLEWGLVVDNTKKGNFDLQVRPAIGRGDPDLYTFELFHTGSSRNYTGISVPELDELLEQGRATMEPEVRKQIYDEVQRLLLEYNPYYYLYAMNEVDVHQTYVKNFQQMPNKSRHLWKNIWVDK